ncbi:MAG: hypothetical protein JXR31_11005 [Prolixibacteraceae bacterium]|nr:hypothetical protein [Prolixibacteraceae bacterium]MBN2774770.1 hypothetical protein [Prolixibacteraceae bacterium]
MIKKLFLLYLIIFTVSSAFAQNIDNYFKNEQAVPFQKLYIHTDREFYFLGETIWFSAYLLDGQNHTPVIGDQNLYVDLIDTSGYVDIFKLYYISDGFSSNGILIPENLPTGKYILRAYTSYIRNFGEESFFYKTISIDKTRSSIELETRGVEKDSSDIKIEAFFMPEGGFLLGNTMNVVAFKITGKDGLGKNASGIVVDEKGEEITKFETSYNGMGKFYLNPVSGKLYKAILDGYPDQYFYLGEVRASGIKIQNVESGNGFIQLGICSNSAEFFNKLYILAVMNRGEVIFTQDVQPAQKEEIIKIPELNLGGGINRLVLLSENLVPLSERLIFSDNYILVEPVISLSDSSFSTRSHVKLQISDFNNLLHGEKCRLSIAVVNENSLNAFGLSQTIRSWLLLNSELNGYIESPEINFEGSLEITSDEKLDLLMQTNGWSNYRWDKIAAMDTGNQDFEIIAGVDVSGYVKYLWRNKRVENGEVILYFYTKRLNTFSTVTNENGQFIFEHLYVTDTTSVAVQAKNRKDKQNTEIFLDPIEIAPLEFHKNNFAAYYSGTGIPIDLYRQDYYARLAAMDFIPEEGAIMIKEVEVPGFQPQKPEIKFSQIYSEPDIAIKVEEGDFMYGDVYEYINLKAPTFLGGQSPMSLKFTPQPLIIVDGIPFELGSGKPDQAELKEFLKRFSLSTIDRIDIIKRHNPTGTAVYGTRGAGG